MQNAADTEKRKGISLAVASGKGGVGKTWLAVNLSQALADLNHKVVIIDADIGFGNVTIQLGLTEQYSLDNLLENKISLTRAITAFSPQFQQEDMDGKTLSSFDVIAGRSGSPRAGRIPRVLIQRLLENCASLSSLYDFLIIDTGAGASDTGLAVSSKADICAVVMTDEPSSLTDAFSFIRSVLPHRKNKDISIIINRVADKEQVQRHFLQIKTMCENFLSFSPTLLGSIEFHADAVHATRQQKTVFSTSPESLVAGNVEALAKNIIELHSLSSL